MNRGFDMHNRARYFVQQRLDDGPAPERGYLQADGVNDYGIAAGGATGSVASGTAGQVCLVVKQAFPILVGKICVPIQMLDLTSPPSVINGGHSSWHFFHGADPLAATARSFDKLANITAQTALSFPAAVGGSPLVYAISRDNVAPSLSTRVAQGAASLTNVTAAGTGSFTREATGVVIGAYRNLDTTVGSFTVMPFVAAVVLTRTPTSAEVEAYSAGNDARLIWPDAIHAYWVASDVVGTSIPARVGAVPMTLHGGWSASDLVAT